MQDISKKMESTLTSKGRLPLPKPLRDVLRLKSGDRIAFERKDDGAYVLRPKTVSVASLKGILKDKYKGPPKTLEEIEEAILFHGSRKGRV